MICSHSSLQTFENCPRSYYYKYIAKIRDEGPENIAAFLGSRVHESLEKLYTAKKDGVTWSADQLVEYYHKAWKEKYDAKTVVCLKKGQTPQGFRNVGEQCLRAYHARHTPFQTGALAVEKQLCFPLDAKGEFKIGGFVDRITERPDGIVEIHDYKTNANLPTQAQQDADRQLALYQIGVQSLWPEFRKIELVWHFLRVDTQIRSTRTPQQLKELKQQTIALMSDIKARGKQEDRFEPRRHQFCDSCGYRHLCPNFSHQSKIDAMPAARYRKEPAAKLIGQHVKLTDKIEALEEQIASLCEKRDHLEEALIHQARKLKVKQLASRTHVALIVDRPCISFPTKSSDAQANAILVDKLRRSSFWHMVCSLNMSVLKGLWKSEDTSDRLLKILKPFVSETTKTRLKVKERQ